MPEWLCNNRVVFDTLLLAWKSPSRIDRLQNEQELSLPQVVIDVPTYLLFFSFCIFSLGAFVNCPFICVFVLSLVAALQLLVTFIRVTNYSSSQAE
jgi:hypothetical protein